MPDVPAPTTAPLRVIHVISGLWRHTGGPAATVPGLCTALAQAGCDVTLAILDGPIADAVWQCRDAGVNVRTFKSNLRHSIWYSAEMARELPALAANADLIHVHGLWEHPMWVGGWAARRLGIPFLISPRGSLEPAALQRSRWKKAPIALCCDGPNLRAATCLHATAEGERDACRAFGLSNPVAIIPNAVTLPDALPPNADLTARFPALRGKRVLLYMSRINPTKGLLDFAEAWARLAPAHPDWHFLMAGPDECDHAAEVLTVFQRLGVADRVTYTGPLYGEERLAAFATAEMAVLPTHHENFGLAVAEALWFGRPVITTQGAPWRGLHDHQCGWWVPIGPEALTTALQAALPLSPAALAAMGARGKEWVNRTFTWQAVARDMLEVYRWLLQQGERPTCVTED